MDSKFHVGDHVKISYHRNGYYQGKTGVVTSAIPQRVDFPELQSTGIYKVRLDGNKTNILDWADDDDLELIN